MHVQKTLIPADDLIKGRKVRLIELFAGVGAQAAALRNIGADFEHHAVVEVDKFAVASYNAIHGTCFEPMDIRNVSAKDLRIEGDDCCYILTYSFPCQDLSSAGLKRGFEENSGTRSSLLWEVGRLLGECASHGRLPDVLLMENVPAVHNEKNLSVFRKWLKRLSALGYTTYYKDLNAMGFGVPQHRVRTFAVSVRGCTAYKFPDEASSDLALSAILDSAADESFIIRTDRAKNFVEKLLAENPDAYAIAENGCCVDLCESKPRILDKCTPALCAKTVSTIDRRPFFKTGVLQQSSNWLGNVWGFSGRSYAGGVYDITKPAPTVLSAGGFAKQPSILSSKAQELCVRRLTPLECWRLMGFSDADFQKAAAVNSNTQLYKQAGNSIVVLVLEAIFKNMGAFKKQ